MGKVDTLLFPMERNLGGPPMTKRSWQVTVPGYNPFRMGGEPMDYAEALATARSIWPMAEVK